MPKKGNAGIPSIWAWAELCIGDCEPVLKPKESNNSGAFPQVVRAGVKESKAVTKSNILDKFTSFKLLESASTNSSTGASKFKVVLITEGLGNMRDAFYYSKAALESAVPIFEGKKIYADHPSSIDDKIRPERSVRDVLGHFENLHLEESKQGEALLCADLVIMPDESFKWAKALMTHAVEFSKKYPDKEFIGLSINASGDAKPVALKDFIESDGVPEGAKPKLVEALNEGIETVRVVTAISDAQSCDLVTEAGAGGKIVNKLTEKDKAMEDKKPHVDPMVGFEKEGTMDAEPHADKGQDMELIKSMIAKHLKGEAPEGDDKEAPTPKEDEAKHEAGEKHHEDEAKKEDEAKHESDDKDANDHEMDMKHAMEAYDYFSKERKMEMDEACKHAAESVKCAKHMQAKMKHAEAKHHADEAKHESEEKKHEAKKHESHKKEDESKKESEIARLAGRIAFLEGQIAKVKVATDIEKILATSKLPRSATKAFKESVGEIKSMDEFKKLFGVFEKAYRAGGAAETVVLDLSIEKTNRFAESEKKAVSTVSDFSDCFKK